MGEIQVTIPQAIRERCGLLPHTEVHGDTNVILDVVGGDPYDLRAIPRVVAFLAARAHAAYPERGGSRPAYSYLVLPAPQGIQDDSQSHHP